MFKVFRKLLTAGEESLFNKLVTHTELSIKSMEIVTDLIKGRTSGPEVEASVLEVIMNEKTGDKITAELINLVSKGAVPLPLLGDIEALIDKIDDILDLIYFLATECGRAYRADLHQNAYVREMYEDLYRTAAIVLKSLESLREELSIALKDFSKLQSLNDLIDIYEDKVDELKSLMLDKLYSFKGKIDAISFNHLVEMIRSMDTIVDSCEDASHLLLRVISSMFY